MGEETGTWNTYTTCQLSKTAKIRTHIYRTPPASFHHVSHTLLPLPQPQRLGRQLGLALGVAESEETPSIPSSHDRHHSYCLCLSPELYLERLNYENCKEQ